MLAVATVVAEDVALDQRRGTVAADGRAVTARGLGVGIEDVADDARRRGQDVDARTEAGAAVLDGEAFQARGRAFAAVEHQHVAAVATIDDGRRRAALADHGDGFAVVIEAFGIAARRYQ